VFDGNNHNKSKPVPRQQQQAALASPRPRRLPTLIKILTGFDDEPYWKSSSNEFSGNINNKPIIARIERPHLLPPARKRSRSSRSKEGALSHKETVQIAAAAAAAAVWSRSLRITSEHRMQRINSEWDAALRWIAGWDQQHLHSRSSWLDGHDGKNDLGKFTANNAESSHGRGNNDVAQEGFNNFVDDLAKLLESCISQCVGDVNFEVRLRKESEEDDEVSVTSFISEMVSKSFLDWLGEITSLRQAFGKVDRSLESRFVLTKTVQFVASSVAIYALLSIWTLVTPMVFHWYSSFGYKESPEWLLEHENEIQLAKSARSRQKKKAKRRQLTMRTGGRSKLVLSHNQLKNYNQGSSVHDDQMPAGTTNVAILASEKVPIILRNEEGHKEPTDSVPGSPCSVSSGGVPSMISCPSTSVSSLPSIKPGSSLLEDTDPYGEPLHAPSPPLLCLNSVPFSQAPPLQHQKSLPVPTQEQRNEAAKQLREFQNAQIQRLLLQRKLHQVWCAGHPAETSAPLRSGSSHSGDSSSSTIAVERRNKVLKPPPGLALPSDPQLPLINQDDKNFLTDNELFLTKLLDDEEDDAVNKTPRQHRIRSSSPESSLDPTAVEFFSMKAVRAQQAKAASPNMQEGDAWQSGPGDLSLNSNSPIRMMKGVYGGSVW
jgi:hypothetical protein